MWKKWKRLLAGFAIVLACAVLAVAVIDWFTAPEEDGEAVQRVHDMAAEAVARYEQQFAQSAGDAAPKGATAATVLYDSLAPSLEQLAEEQPFQNALTLQEEKRWSDWTEDEIGTLAAFLDEHAALLGDIRTLADLGEPVYHVDLNDGRQAELPHLAKLRAMARLLRFDAAVRADSGDLEGAMEDYLAILKLGETLAEEPFTISQLVRVRLVSIAFEGMGSAFPSDGLSLEQARSFARKTEGLYHREGFASALSGEAMHALDAMTRDPFSSENTAPVITETNTVTLLLLYPSPLGDNIVNADRQTCAAFMERLIRAAERPYYEVEAELRAIEAELSGLSFLKGYTKFFVRHLTRIQVSQAFNEAHLDLMRIGLLLEGHYAETGNYPANLNALADEFGDDLPVDPFTGESYIYVLKGDTFLLYSVVMNQVDDGGKHAYVEGDIVWRGVEEPETPDVGASAE